MGNRLAVDELARRQFADEVANYLAGVEDAFGVRIVQVAIDAPRTPSAGGRRAAELAMDRAGVSCIATPTQAEFDEMPRRIADYLRAGGSKRDSTRTNFGCWSVLTSSVVSKKTTPALRSSRTP
jgi:hypothetical protein